MFLNLCSVEGRPYCKSAENHPATSKAPFRLNDVQQGTLFEVIRLSWEDTTLSNWKWREAGTGRYLITLSFVLANYVFEFNISVPYIISYIAVQSQFVLPNQRRFFPMSCRTLAQSHGGHENWGFPRNKTDRFFFFKKNIKMINFKASLKKTHKWKSKDHFQLLLHCIFWPGASKMEERVQ